ncbi:MAG: sigma-54-dependent Fis family transcriptional regulator [Gammaproteobacteria bacterium]|nr:sigma-54-dependent Fis family transcriptional regulator [Gammaproteobacteria bacterium]
MKSREKPGLILIDDDPLIVDSVTFALEDEFAVHAAGSRAEAVAMLRSMTHPPALALVDLGLPPTPHAPDEGFALIRDLLGFNRAMKILVLSGQGRRANIQHALTLGAVDFLPKPCDAQLLRARLNHQLMILDAELPERGAADGSAALLLGDSSSIAALRAMISQFANTPFPVLIEGESGVGKELVASCLHRESERSEQPMLTVNCTAFSPELLEAQLFGHRRGAFTGATEERPGFFEVAARGTLFLDEIGEMPLELQPKLLRVLENGDYYRLGETTLRRSEARVIAASNRDLREAVRTGSFRADLFHRLSVLTISVPPLRARGADWAILLEAFQRQYARNVAPFQLADDARSLLAGYHFPGNVRELRNIVIRLGAKFPGQTVTASQLASELEPVVGPGAMTAPGDLSEVAVEQVLQRTDFRLEDSLMAYEKRLIETALRMSDGNLSRTARLLNVNRTTLYNKMQRLGLAGS